MTFGVSSKSDSIQQFVRVVYTCASSTSTKNTFRIRIRIVYISLRCGKTILLQLQLCVFRLFSVAYLCRPIRVRVSCVPMATICSHSGDARCGGGARRGGLQVYTSR